jgi:hypothetical protein
MDTVLSARVEKQMLLKTTIHELGFLGLEGQERIRPHWED